MRAIDLIVIHCSSTRESYALTEQALEASHRLIGFDGTGYHFYVRRDGRVLAWYELLGRAEDMEKEVDRYRSVTAEQLRAVAQSAFRKENGVILYYKKQQN